MTIAAIIDHYLDEKEKRYKAMNAPVRNHYELKISLNPIKARWGALYPHSIDRRAVQEMIDEEREAKRSNATVKRRLDILVAALNLAKRDGWIDTVPNIEKPTPPQPRDKWASPEQIRILMNAIETPHVRLFSLLALHTLSRKAAILELKWSQVDMKNRRINFNTPGREETNKRRVANHINNSLYAALSDAQDIATSDYVIEFGSKGINEIGRAFRRAATRARLAWITPHVLRHTGATLLAQAGTPLSEIAGLMGDSVATVQKHYLHHCPEHLKVAANDLDKLYG